ncbi:TRAP transporter small permease [Tritonibacter horizontis]|uniref:TRAP transporter small permease protein n=1 Tax=Tritonibacter horizontis TaxID=1768241 RepID=A0A132BU65_9RHOB|nr:TRAP transporter small permease [Tritonibacter horizontis]KUP91602.1 2,3-diketo-L-gulonate TRAP transporter small permease protein YiaM [Tritonibacter horizontis]
MSARADEQASTLLDNLGRLLSRAADVVGITLFLAAFAGFILQVFFRYVMGTPLIWSEEFVMIAFIWTVFWAAAFIVPIREHVTFDVVYVVLSPAWQRALAIFAMITGIIAFGLLVLPVLDYLDFLTRKKSPVLRIPMHWIYGCYLFFVVGFLFKLLARLIQLLGPNWRKAL